MTTPSSNPSLALQQSMVRRALAARDAGRLHLRFAPALLERYREAGCELLRTRSVGRISSGRRWSVDVGIAPDGSIHLPFKDILERLPEDEWPHWLAHLAVEPMSAAFIQMRMTVGACIDDGDTEVWT